MVGSPKTQQCSPDGPRSVDPGRLLVHYGTRTSAVVVELVRQHPTCIRADMYSHQHGALLEIACNMYSTGGHELKARLMGMSDDSYTTYPTASCVSQELSLPNSLTQVAAHGVGCRSVPCPSLTFRETLLASAASSAMFEPLPSGRERSLQQAPYLPPSHHLAMSRSSVTSPLLPTNNKQEKYRLPNPRSSCAHCTHSPARAVGTTCPVLPAASHCLSLLPAVGPEAGTELRPWVPAPSLKHPP